MKTLQISIDDAMWAKLQLLADQEGQAVEDVAAQEFKKVLERQSTPQFSWPTIIREHSHVFQGRTNAFVSITSVLLKGEFRDLTDLQRELLEDLLEHGLTLSRYMYDLQGLALIELNNIDFNFDKSDLQAIIEQAIRLDTRFKEPLFQLVLSEFPVSVMADALRLSSAFRSLIGIARSSNNLVELSVANEQQAVTILIRFC